MATEASKNNPKAVPGDVPKPKEPEKRKQVEEIMGTGRIREPEKIRSQAFGLKVLYQPEEDDIDVDIVAVHGIGVNPENTWVFRGKGAEAKNVNWLSDMEMLPKALPNARIMAFGYASYWFGQNAVRQSLDGAGTSLLKELEDKRETCPHRPIIFVGHCFGGLVIQSAYATATLHKADFPDISDSTVGIVFLGTPHQGLQDNSELQTQGKLYQAIVAANVMVEDNILHTMAQDNDLLVKTVHDFTRVAGQKHGPKLFCFFEQQATNIGLIAGITGIPKKFIVNERSGTLNGCEKEALALNHFSMNKFEDCEDNNYCRVRREIAKMAKKARGIMEERGSGKKPASATPRASGYHIPSFAAPICEEADFATRENILHTLEKRFRKAMTVVLCGDIGNGKTHVAVQYAHTFHRENRASHVLWVNAGSAVEFELSFKRLASSLHIKKDGKGGSMVKAVCDELKQNGDWLMILDGLDSKEALRATDSSQGKKSLLDYIPKAHLARVLITTRDKQLAMQMVNQKSVYVIDVPTLGDADASLVLLGSTKCDEVKMRRAIRVAKGLGASAGTLVLASQYSQIARLTPVKYAELLNSQKTPQIGVAGSSTMRAWWLLYGHIQKNHADAARLLMVIGSFNVQSIPKVFFEREELYDQITKLVDAGMVEPSKDSRIYIVTPLIRQCVQTWLIQAKEKELYETKALSVLCDKFKVNEEEVGSCEDLLPCALSALLFQVASVDGKRYLATLRYEVARYYLRRKKHGAALECFELCLKIQEQDPEKHEKSTAETVQAIKKLKRDMAKAKPEGDVERKLESSTDQVAKAKKLLEEVEKSLGRTHPDAIRQMNDTATFQLMHGNESDVAEALSHYKQVLDWCKTKYGESSMDTALRQFNLAIGHDEQGQYDAAAEHYHAASKVAESHLGPGHPLLLKMLGNLALIYCRQNQLKKGQELLQAVLQNQQDALGWDHPETLTTRQNLAMVMENLGQVDDAGEKLQKIFSVQSKLLGADDRATLRTSCSLASNYGLRGMPEKAEKLLEQTLSSQRKKWGRSDRDAIKTERILTELKPQLAKVAVK